MQKRRYLPTLIVVAVLLVVYTLAGERPAPAEGKARDAGIFMELKLK